MDRALNLGEQDLEAVEQLLTSVDGNETPNISEVPATRGRSVQAVPETKTARTPFKHRQHMARKMSSEKSTDAETDTKWPYTIEITLIPPDELHWALESSFS